MPPTERRAGSTTVTRWSLYKVTGLDRRTHTVLLSFRLPSFSELWASEQLHLLLRRPCSPSLCLRAAFRWVDHSYLPFSRDSWDKDRREIKDLGLRPWKPSSFQDPFTAAPADKMFPLNLNLDPDRGDFERHYCRVGPFMKNPLFLDQTTAAVMAAGETCNSGKIPDSTGDFQNQTRNLHNFF